MLIASKDLKMLMGHSPTEKRSGGFYTGKNIAWQTRKAVNRRDISKQSGTSVPKSGDPRELLQILISSFALGCSTFLLIC